MELTARLEIAAIYCAHADALYDAENGTHTENIVEDIFADLDTAKAACEEAITNATLPPTLFNPFTAKLVRAWVSRKVIFEGERRYKDCGRMYRNSFGEWVEE